MKQKKETEFLMALQFISRWNIYYDVQRVAQYTNPIPSLRETPGYLIGSQHPP